MFLKLILKPVVCCAKLYSILQELWVLLASAAATESGIPQKLLDDKEAELKKKKELEDQINVSMSPYSANLQYGFHSELHQFQNKVITVGRGYPWGLILNNIIGQEESLLCSSSRITLKDLIADL